MLRHNSGFSNVDQTKNNFSHNTIYLMRRAVGNINQLKIRIIMLMAGRFIRQKNDPLQKVTLERVYRGIKAPKEGVRNQIKQLRAIQSIDWNRYRQLKTELPYIVCGQFHPPFRRTENFGSIQYFILDIDHLLEKEMDINRLKSQLQEDQRVVLLFKSPGNNGLKVFFRLKNKCHDAAQYSIFYKAFALKFSQQYQLQQVIDKATSDVTRACFVSWDEKAWYNADAIEIEMKDFVNFDNLWEVRKLERTLKKEEKNKASSPSTPKEEKRLLTEELLQEIKQKLKPVPVTKPAKIIYVPEELELIIDKVHDSVKAHDILVKSISNIHYGKKMEFTFGPTKWTEMNIFYGRKGYTVVKSPKRGRDEVLEEVVYTILCGLFYKDQ